MQPCNYGVSVGTFQESGLIQYSYNFNREMIVTKANVYNGKSYVIKNELLSLVYFSELLHYCGRNHTIAEKRLP